MQLTAIPQQVIESNRAVVEALGTAHEITARVKTEFTRDGASGPAVRQDLQRAAELVVQAREGVKALGADNLIDGALLRWAHHAHVELNSALMRLGRRGPLPAATRPFFAKDLAEAELGIRVAVEAGERSLASPRHRILQRASEFIQSPGNSETGPVWVDGQWLDSLGNPVRGGDSWTGPDGQSFDGSGSPVDSGDGWVSGPDGSTYVGI